MLYLSDIFCVYFCNLLGAQNLPLQMTSISSNRKLTIRYSYEQSSGYVTKALINNDVQYRITW